jgi:SAM-dependent methyltransferase
LKDRCPELSHAVGVDLGPAAVDYARRRYAVDGIEYRTGDAHEFRDEQRFETIVSLETIEHLPDPERFLDNALEHVVAPGGRMICSVPVTPSVDANPHHLHDFTEASFRRMFRRRGLRELACLRQIQPFRLSSVVGNSEGRARDVRRNLPAYYWAHPMSFVSRVLSTLRYGLQNRYLTIAWAVPD